MFSAEHVSLKLAGRDLFQSLSFKLPASEHLGLKGPSGCGKSTLLRMLAALQHPNAGQFLLNEEPFAQPIFRHREQVAYVAQDPLLSGATLLEAVNLGLDIQKKESLSEEELRPLLDDLGLAHLSLDHDPSRVSGGERMRLAILRALVTKPKILLLDEPTAALDPKAKTALMEMLFVGSNTRPKQILSVSHDPLWFENCASMWHLEQGALHGE